MNRSDLTHREHQFRSRGDEALPSSRLRLLPTVLTGLYSWALTVLPVVASENSLGLSGISALLAVFALLSSLALPPGRPAIFAAVDLFVVASAFAWWTSRDLAVGLPFPIFGSLGWFCYTLAVGALSMPPSLKDGLLGAQQFRPRTPPSRLAAVILLLALAGGVTLLLSAWRVERPHVAVLAQVFALSCALLLLRSGASLAVHFQRRGTQIRSDLGFRRAIFPLICFLSLALAGALGLRMAG